MKQLFCATLLLSCLACAGCSGLQSGVYREGLVTESGEPAYITVQHCLIGFEGSVPSAARSMEEAEQLAGQLFEQAKSVEDFGDIVRKYTDDSPPGIYKMANHGFDPDMTSKVPSNQVYARSGMVAAFGDIGFPLEVGQIGMAPYDPKNSPFGWHIIKRIK